MARSKTAQELYRLMSEVISLRERVAQAEPAATESRLHSSAAKDGGGGMTCENGTIQRSGAGDNQLLNNPRENHLRRNGGLQAFESPDLLLRLPLKPLDSDLWRPLAGGCPAIEG
jgi:hypothetical protein